MNGTEPPADALRGALAERTADLQRVKAEYDNYRKRVRRDRVAVREIAVANVLRALLPVLDAVDRARRHGSTSGTGTGSAAGTEEIVRTLQEQLAALGLQTFGEPGDPFDPTLHEAVARRGTTGGEGGGAESGDGGADGASRFVCAEILSPGYRVGGHLLRAATVTVTEPDPARRP